MTLADIAQILRAAADEADRLAAERRQQRADWIDQTVSPLRPKRHNAAVRRLLAEGAPGAAKIGRRHLLSPEALAEELQRVSRAPRKKAEAPSVAAELRAELRLVGR